MQTSQERDPQERARRAQPNRLSPPRMLLQAQGCEDILPVTSSSPPLLPPGQVRLCISSSTRGLAARATFPAPFGELPRDPGKEAGLEPNTRATRTCPLSPAPRPPRRAAGWRTATQMPKPEALQLGGWPLRPAFTHGTFLREKLRATGRTAAPGVGRDGCRDTGSPMPRLRGPRAEQAALSSPALQEGPSAPARGPERATHPAPSGEKTARAPHAEPRPPAPQARRQSPHRRPRAAAGSQPPAPPGELPAPL